MILTALSDASYESRAWSTPPYDLSARQQISLKMGNLTNLEE